MDEPTRPNTLVFLIQSPKRTARLNLEGPFFVVGRGEPFPVFHDDPTLSREHATIVDTGDGYAVKDLGSRNGVTINGDRIDRYGEVPFREGDLLQAGATTIRLVQVAELEARRSEASAEEEPEHDPITVDEAGLTGQHPAVQPIETDAFRGEETGLIDPGTGSFDGTATEMAWEEDDEGELSVSDDAELEFPDLADTEETLEMAGPHDVAVQQLLAREEPLTAEELVDLGELAAEIEDVIPTQMGVPVSGADEATVEMDPPPGAIDALDEDGETTLGLEPPQALLE